MNYITIRDTITGKEITVSQLPNNTAFVVVETNGIPTETRTRSVGKVIRTWMKERKKEVG